MSKVKFKIPDSVREKYTGEKCSTCNSPIFLIDGQRICGGCSIADKKRNYDKQKDANIDPNRLKDYNSEKYRKKEKSTLEKSIGPVIENTIKQYKD